TCGTGCSGSDWRSCISPLGTPKKSTLRTPRTTPVVGRQPSTPPGVLTARVPSGLSEGIQSGRICAGRAQDCSSGSHLGRKGERPLNIVQIVTRTDSIGGAQVHVRDLALGLIRDGHQVTVLAGGTGPFAKELEAHNIRYQPLCHLVRPIRPLTDLRALIELRSALKSIGPDL